MKGEVHGWSCYATLAGLAGPSRLFSCNQLSVPPSSVPTLAEQRLSPGLLLDDAPRSVAQTISLERTPRGWGYELITACSGDTLDGRR